MSESLSDVFVSAVAFALAATAIFLALQLPARGTGFRVVRMLYERFGMWAARIFLLIVAVGLMLIGSAIFFGVRPGFSRPALQSDQQRLPPGH